LGSSWLRVVLYAQPPLTKALSPAWNYASVNSFHTTHFHQRTVDLRWSFPMYCFNFDVRSLIIISHSTWDSNSRHFNALSFPRAHTSGDKIHCTSFQKVSSATAEMAGQMASLFTQCYQRVHFFLKSPSYVSIHIKYLLCHVYLNAIIDWKSEVEAIAEVWAMVGRYVS
jgi:hypothetical protein